MFIRLLLQKFDGMQLKNQNRKIAYTAVLTAISFVMVVSLRFLPLSFFPLIVAALVLYYNIAKCGILWGLLQAAAVSTLGFLTVVPEIFGYVLLAAPYAVIVFYLDKLKMHNKFVLVLIRYSLLLVFFNIAIWTIYTFASATLFSMNLLVEVLWNNYFLFAALLSVLFIMCDISFEFIYGQLVRRKIFK